MANNNYSEKLKHPKWQRKRLEIMQRDNFKCQLCGDSENELHVHHIEYSDGEPWEIENEKLITVCGACHKIYHDFLSDYKLDISDFRINKILSKSKQFYLFTILVIPLDYILIISMDIDFNINYPAQIIDRDRLNLISKMFLS